MSALARDIAAFDRARRDLEAHHKGEWAVFHAGQFVGVYPDFEDAAADVLDRFGEEPTLIRQIGVEAVALSGAMIIRPVHENGASGL